MWGNARFYFGTSSIYYYINGLRNALKNALPLMSADDIMICLLYSDIDGLIREAS